MHCTAVQCNEQFFCRENDAKIHFNSDAEEIELGNEHQM